MSVVEAERSGPGSFTTQTGSALALQVLTLGLLSVSGIVSARALGADGRGIVATAAAAPQLVALVLALGFGVSNAYFVARGDIDVRSALGTSLAATAIVAATVSPAYVLVVLGLRGEASTSDSLLFLVFGAIQIPVALGMKYVLGVAQGVRRIRLMYGTAALQAAVTLALYLAFLVAMGGDALTAFAIVTLASLVVLLLMLMILWRDYGRPRWAPGYARKAMRFGAKGELSNVVAYLGYRVDVLIVSALAGFEAVGLYAVAFTLVELLWIVPNVLSSSLYPHVAAASDNTAALPQTLGLARTVLVVLLIGGVVGAALAPILVPVLFGEQFEGSVAALQVLVPGVVLFGVGKVLSAHLAGMGRPGVTTVANAIGLVLMVALDLALIPGFGVVGAATASSSAYAAVFLVQLGIFHHLTGARVVDVLIPRRSDFGRLASVIKKRPLLGGSRS